MGYHALTEAPAGIVITAVETGDKRPVLQAMESPVTLITGLLVEGARTPTSWPWSTLFTLRRWKML